MQRRSVQRGARWRENAKKKDRQRPNRGGEREAAMEKIRTERGRERKD